MNRIAVSGANPPIPLVHEEDTARATGSILLQASPGAYDLNAPNPVPLREITRRIGARVMALPPSMVYPLAGAAWKLHLRALSEAPPAMPDYIRYH
jgi:NAD dependent epimerase/dehydratase family enzyme